MDLLNWHSQKRSVAPDDDNEVYSLVKVRLQLLKILDSISVLPFYSRVSSKFEMDVTLPISSADQVKGCLRLPCCLN